MKATSTRIWKRWPFAERRTTKRPVQPAPFDGDRRCGVGSTRTRRYSALKVVRAYCRRAQRIDRMILSCFVLGFYPEGGRGALSGVGGEVSASREPVGKQLDQVVKAFHRRALRDQYRVLIFDGVVLSRRVAPERFAGRSWCVGDSAGWEEGDHRLSAGQGRMLSAWEAFFNDLYRRD